MTSKLTLSLKKSIIEKAKLYAKDTNQSLSQMVEDYLYKITSEQNNIKDKELDKIRGIINLEDDFDIKKERSKYRKEKHG